MHRARLACLVYRPIGVVAAIVLLSACELLPVHGPQAPVLKDVLQSRAVAGTAYQPCASIHWQNLGGAKDINQAIMDHSRGGSLTNTSYGSRRAAIDHTAVQESESFGKPIENGQLRSERSVELSVEFPGEYQKAYLQAIESWLRQHVAVEVHSCPR